MRGEGGVKGELRWCKAPYLSEEDLPHQLARENDQHQGLRTGVRNRVTGEMMPYGQVKQGDGSKR